MFTNNKRPSLFLAWFLVTKIIAINCANAETSIISKTVVEGNKRIEKETIEEYLNLKPLDKADLDLDSAIKSLYATKMFDDIKLNFSDSVLHVKVKENRLISDIRFEGIKGPYSKLLDILNAKRGKSLTKKMLQDDVRNILDYYKASGRFLTTVNVTVVEKENNRAEVIFNIVESPKIDIKRIYIVGNHAFDSHKLKSVLNTNEKTFNIFSRRVYYHPSNIETDKEMLRRFYQSNGYINFRVVSATAELSKSKDSFNIIYVVDEGEKFEIRNVQITNNIDDQNLNKYLSSLNITPGQIYSKNKVELSLDRLEIALRNTKDYLDATCAIDVTQDNNNKSIDVNFLVNKSPKVYIDKINISGNYKTMDKLIRSKFRLKEGDLYSPNALKTLKRNLQRTDFFETVEVVPEIRNGTGFVDINIDVQEKSTTNMGLDFGYDTSQGIFGRLILLERNFAGTGVVSRIETMKTSSGSDHKFTIIDPNFNDKDLLVGLTLVKSDSSIDHEDIYDQDTKLAKLYLQYNLTESLEHELYYKIKDQDLTLTQKIKKRIAEGKIKEDKYIGELEIGGTISSIIGHELSWDIISNYDSKSRMDFVINQEIAGLGGDAKYLKHDASLTMSRSFFDETVTLTTRASFGHIFGFSKYAISIADRFKLGDQTLRGFEISGIGPRDKETKDSLKGKKYYSIITELDFPLVSTKESQIKCGFFNDIGGLWDHEKLSNKVKSLSKERIYDTPSPRVSIGFGISILNRIAPIRLDYAIPIIYDKNFDRTKRFHFSMNRQF